MHRFRPLFPLLVAATLLPAAGQTVRKAEPASDEEATGAAAPARRQPPGRKAPAAPSAAAAPATRKDPYDPLDVANRTAALIRAGRPREAVDYLMDLKIQYKDFFPHQLALGDAFTSAGMFHDAAAAYQVIVDEDDYSAAQRGAARRRLQNLARERQSIADGQPVRPNGNVPPARQAPSELETRSGDHPDAMALRASALTKEGRFDEARALLNQAAAAGQRSRTLTEARLALAEAERAGGSWGPAAADYREAARGKELPPRERNRAGGLSREMQARVRPTFQAELHGSDGREGTLWTSGIEVSTGAFGDGRHIVFLRGVWDEIGLGHQQLISRADADRFQAEAAWRRLTRRGFYGEVTAGGGDTGGTWGAAVGRYGPPGPGWELRFRANERATDSLLLRALGGTQDSLVLRYRRPLAERWVVDAKLGWRRVEIEDRNLGDGIDLDFRLVYTLVEEGDRRPGVTAAYFAEVQHFDRRDFRARRQEDWPGYARREDDPADFLIDDRINRHGLLFTAAKQFGARWSGFAYGGVAYEFEDDRAEALAGAGITAYIKDNTTLIFSVDYSSSGNAGNKGDDVITGAVNMRVSF